MTRLSCRDTDFRNLSPHGFVRGAVKNFSEPPAWFLCVLLLLAVSAASYAQSTTADSIMARVAENQDRAESKRQNYVYVQHSHIVSRRGQRVMCEETTDYRVVPSEVGSHQELLSLDGRVLIKGKYLSYHSLLPTDEGTKPQETNDDSITITAGDEDADRDIVEHMRANLMADKTRDGIGGGLFPLTSKKQRDYIFSLVGKERLNGRDVFHIHFQPRDKDEFDWKGDAYIDVEAYEPVALNTSLARKVPIAVRTLLGRNVPGLGFSVTYAPQADGVWFPVSFGTEFKLHVLFFFAREITIAAQNRDFEKTHVSSTMIVKKPSAQP